MKDKHIPIADRRPRRNFDCVPELHVKNKPVRIANAGASSLAPGVGLASGGNWEPVIDAALKVGLERDKLFRELRKAVLAKNSEAVFNIAKQLVGGAG